MTILHTWRVAIRTEPGAELTEEGHERLSAAVEALSDDLAKVVDERLRHLPGELRDGLEIVVTEEHE